VPAAGGVLSVGLLPVPPPAGGVDGGDTVVGELLVGVGAGEGTLDLADWDGWAELVAQCVPVAPAGCLPLVALLLDFAEAVVLALAAELAFALPVAGVVAVPVVVVALSPGLPPVLSLAGLLAELAGGVLGVTDLVDAAGAALAGDDEPGEHGVTGALLWTAEVPAPPAPPATPADAPAGVAVAFRLGAGPLEPGPEIPTAEPSWTTAWRSGGTARATPMANTAQAVASAGRSHPYRQSSRGCRWPAPAACCPAPAASCPAPAASCPPRAASQRRTRPARKPLRAAECLLA